MKKFFSLLFMAAAVFAFPVLCAGDEVEPAHECTSWMVFSNLTKNNTNILHKNRDSKIRNVAAYMSAPNAKRKWIAIGNASTNSGMNSSGLAGAMNSGEKTPDPANPKGQGRKDTVVLLEVVLIGQLPHAHYTRWYSNQGGSRKEGQGKECVGGVERVE